MDFKYKIFDGEVTITGYNGITVESIIIPEFIDNLLVTKIGSFSFAHRDTTLNIILPNSVTYLGENSFIGNDMLIINNIELKEGVNVVNNRFIFYNGYTSNIMYQINDDYVCDDGYFMDSEFKNRLMCSYGF